MPQPTKVYTDDEFDDPYFADPLDEIPSTRDDRALALVAHLSSLVGVGLIAPLVIYLVKKNDSPFVADQAKEAINFHLSLILTMVASIALIAFSAEALPILIPVGIVGILSVAIGSVVLAIVAAIRANDGEAYRYPFTLRLVR